MNNQQQDSYKYLRGNYPREVVVVGPVSQRGRLILSFVNCAAAAHCLLRKPIVGVRVSDMEHLAASFEPEFETVDNRIMFEDSLCRIVIGKKAKAVYSLIGSKRLMVLAS
jgi:hypothetical protein